MCRRLQSFCAVGAMLILPSPGQEVSPPTVTLWPVAELTRSAPAAEFGPADGLTKPVWYDGEPWRGKAIRIFAWLGEPEGGKDEKHPAVLLVPGGGGSAYKDWARYWAARGYVALAMDTAGQGPDGKAHAQAGPPQGDDAKFQNFTDSQARDQWTWHAVAAVLRGHGLLASLPQVDAGRIGITGISWGGYLTCLVAGLDPDLKAAVPVYGCGFLGDNSCWKDGPLAALAPDSRARWLAYFDPSQVVGYAVCPVLMVNGMHDFAYPPDSHAKTGRLVREERRHWSLRVDMAHGHIWTFPEVDAFMDQHLRPGAASVPLVKLGPVRQDGRKITVPIGPGTAVTGAYLHFTTETGKWQERQWQTLPVAIGQDSLTAELPAATPLAYFVAVTDAKGFTVSTDCVELP